MSLLRRLESGQTDGNGESNQKPPSEAEQLYDPFNGHAEIYMKVLSRLHPAFDSQPSYTRSSRRTIEDLLNTILQEDNIGLGDAELKRLTEAIIAEIFGVGPLEILLADESISGIMINGPKDVFVERQGSLARSNIQFEDDAYLLKMLNRMLSGDQELDPKTRIVNIVLADGTRVNAVLPPFAQSGPTLTIRKVPKKRMLQVDDLIRSGTMTEQVAEYLRACVIARLNIVVSGRGAGSGKTTLLNVLSNFIPNEKRIITIEPTCELQLHQEHVISLVAFPSGYDSSAVGTPHDILPELVRNVIRMRPDRIVFSDVRAGEALDIIEAMNTGHDGSILSLRAPSPRDALARLEVMCQMAGMDLPVRAIRELLASALNLIVQFERLRDGTRKIVKITEIQGMEGDLISMSDIFEFVQTGIEAGKVTGHIRPTGWRPKFLDQLEAAGFHLLPTYPVIGISQDEVPTPSQQAKSASDEQPPATDG